MLKPLMANIGDLGDYINCKIGQTPQLFHSANRIFHCPWIRFHPHSRVPTKERRTKDEAGILGAAVEFPFERSSSPAIVHRRFRPSYTYAYSSCQQMYLMDTPGPKSLFNAL